MFSSFSQCEPTSLIPDPTLFLHDNREKEKKCQQFERGQCSCKRPVSSKVTISRKRLVLSDDKRVHDNDIKERCNLAPILLACEHFTCEHDVNFYTGFSTTALFKTIFNHVAGKAHFMT